MRLRPPLKENKGGGLVSDISVLMTIKDYDLLIKKAEVILGGTPYFSGLWKTDYSRLVINGDEVSVISPDASDGTIYRDESLRFPAHLLVMSEQEIALWKKEHDRIYKEKEADMAKQKAKTAALVKEAQERAAFEYLKKKYGA